jgi:thymidine phosphorylase
MSGVVNRLCASIEAQTAMDKNDLQSFIDGVAERTLPIEDITRWLKTVHAHGMSVEDTVALTTGMMHSGAVLQWEKDRPVADKHSTGGVGDKMSLMLAPALAACGANVPMLAGRGLGHTGGTIDKLESIPGFNCALNPKQMQSIVDVVGCCIAAQNEAIAPADGLLYAIRDVTDTVDSIPLITASIVSKKAAEGLQALVLDVKCGQAAFMKTEPEAIALAQSMVNTAKGLGIRTMAQITDMNQPIGTHIGNALEIIESIEVLSGRGPQDTINLVAMQGGAILWLLGMSETEEVGRQMITESLNDGRALTRFKQMCLAQGTTDEVAHQIVSNPRAILAHATHVTQFTPHESGWIESVDSMTLAKVAREHRAGRFAITDAIDPAVGFILHAVKGDAIHSGDSWIEFHHNMPLTSEQKSRLEAAVRITTGQTQPVERLLKVIQ